jgi:hypothetical protein
MAIAFTCACEEVMKCKEELPGRRARCKGCGKEFVIPGGRLIVLASFILPFSAQGTFGIHRLRRPQSKPAVEPLEERVAQNGSSGGVLIGQTQQIANILYWRIQNDASVPSGYSGNAAAGVPGGLSDSYLQAIDDAINDYDALAGVPGYKLFDPILNTDAQHWAMVMAANDILTHSPPPGLHFLNGQDPITAASSELVLGAAGVSAINFLMADPGAVNNPVGHRRGILDPFPTTEGWGEVSTATPPNILTAAALYVDTDYSSEVAAPTTGIPWPPSGAFPFALPEKWSFQINSPNVDFTGASVSVVGPQGPLATSIIIADSPSSPEYGESFALVWTVPNAPTGQQGGNYDVTITGVRVNGQLQNFSYTVSTFVPTPTNEPLPSQVEFLNPVNQGNSGAATTQVLLARSLDVSQSLTVTIQGYGPVNFGAGQIYASADLPPGTYSLANPVGGIIAPGGGTTQVQIPGGGGGGGGGEGVPQPAVFLSVTEFVPVGPRHSHKHPKPEDEINFSGPVRPNTGSLSVVRIVRVKGKGKKHLPAIKSVSLVLTSTGAEPDGSIVFSVKKRPGQGIETVTGTGIIDQNGQTVPTFTSGALPVR